MTCLNKLSWHIEILAVESRQYARQFIEASHTVASNHSINRAIELPQPFRRAVSKFI